jgi:hypothetical protein
MASVKPEPNSPDTSTLTAAGGGGVLDASPPPLPSPPHPNMSRARPITDPMKRNMFIPLLWFADEDHLSPNTAGRA